MRRISQVLSIAATVAALSTPALAQDERYVAPNYAAPVAGAAVGTVVGVGLYNGWFGSATAAFPAFPATAAGAATVGGVAAIGTVALIDAAVQPCAGFHAIFGLNKDRCVNGQYVAAGPAPRRVIVR